MAHRPCLEVVGKLTSAHMPTCSSSGIISPGSAFLNPPKGLLGLSNFNLLRCQPWNLSGGGSEFGDRLLKFIIRQTKQLVVSNSVVRTYYAVRMRFKSNRAGFEVMDV